MLHLISFYTQGPPFDNAKDFTESRKKFQALYEPHVDVLKLYNTTFMMVKNAQFKNYIDSVPAYKFLNGWNHHFWKWKPFVLYEHLKEMEEGDIVVYHDGDILAHPEYEKGAFEFRENVHELMANHDLVCSLDTLYGINKEVIKEEVFQHFGDYRETKTLSTNRIFIRKTPKTVQFVYNWLSLCNTSLLLPNFTEKHMCSQSLFNVLYYKYLELGEFTHPNLYLKDNHFSKESIFFLDKLTTPSTIVPVTFDPFSEKRPTVVTPARRMLQPHQSARSSTMTLIPIAKPPPTFVHKKPASFFTLNKHAR